MKKEFKKAYQQFLDEWGEDSQERMAIEEMSELTKELCKKMRLCYDDFGEANEQKLQITNQNIKEEIADVLNMAEQLELYYGEEEIEKIRKQKIQRTLQLLKAGK